ncbi:MAG: LacI family DNA-binding transcriptional regulator [Bacteroidales bacterium]|jgi:LacI family transcriptional regulator|nr:LacI family DNA-binding transcriptional regulator [Bacteroidales bacterium]
MKAKKVTLSSIATELKVSKTLVSLVLNGKADALAINKLTQQKVLDKARELNYKPNQVARGLRMGQTKTLGLLVADISNPFYARITRTIEHEAEKAGYSLIVCSSDESKEREIRLLKTLLNRQVDGIIMTTTQRDPNTLHELLPHHFPLVLVDRRLAGFESNFVGVDNVLSTENAINHLIEIGHKNIGFLSLTPDYISSLSERKAGYLQAFERHSIAVNNNYIWQLDYLKIKNKDYGQLHQFLLDHPEITAIFTANNNLAVACLSVAKKLGKKIPKDLSLITFDDVELFEYTAPALSSIAQPLEIMGQKSLHILLQQLKNDNFTPQKEILATQLNLRESLCGIK